ncbi:MAG: aldehyde dehydrogenase family protein [Oscillospiraceae bacterium]|nr:aldehyde dehydrogenase family protein [Oscillospiraceae bacterium]
MKVIDSDLLSVQEARICAENARVAQKKLAEFSGARLDKIVEGIATDLEPHLKELAHLSHAETEYGNWQHKYLKNQFVCNQVRRALREVRCLGMICEDREQRTMDVGVPLGVVIGLCPPTSPVSTAIFQTLIAVKSGNAIIFSPPPLAKQTSFRVLDLLIESAEKHGLPNGAISYLSTVSRPGTIELMRHEAVSVIVNTGVGELLEPALQSGKKVIYGGPGNGPVFIERTANIQRAVKDIIQSKTFDNGIVAAAEHSLVVEACISDAVKHELQQNGAFFMTGEQSDALGEILFSKDGSLNGEVIGISAVKLAKRAGFHVPDHTSVLISEQKYVFRENPYAKEKLCPVLAYYVEEDWENACEKCIELLIGERQGHTLVIHSEDEEVIRQFILRKPVARVLVNTPAVFGGIGLTTNLMPSMTLGSGALGSGITSDNVSPMNLVYIRKVGYGVRGVPEGWL